MPAQLYLNVAVSGILTGLVYGLMALGLSVIFGVVRVVNFAHGEMMTIAMYLAIVLFAAFLVIEARIAAPLVPLRIFRQRNFTTTNIIGILWSAAMFAWFFLSALYMQLVLDYTPMQIGLAFLPANLIMAAFSLGLSAKIVMRFGNRTPITVGMALVAVGLVLFSIAPVNGLARSTHPRMGSPLCRQTLAESRS